MDPDPNYRAIDGAWLSEGENYAVLHRTMVSDGFRHSGLSREMVSLAADLAAGVGRTSLRLDTHRDNGAMNGLAKKLGFVYCGTVDLGNMEPGHDALRNAYEKLLF